jgi:hypothetical protein
MQNDIKVSSCLLLILIGLAIYMLLNSNNSSKSSNQENFEDMMIPSSEPPSIMQSDMNVIPSTGVREPIVPSSVINAIAASPEVSNQPIKYTTSVDLNTPLTGADFQGFNLEDMNENAELADAFNPPVPSGTKVDTVDFKKQNLESYNAKDFLPKEINDEWFETDFSLAKYQLNDDKLINTERYIIGINTVGQSLKNATYDIRGTIPNPKFVVSPWNQSTYEPDFNLKPLC